VASRCSSRSVRRPDGGREGKGVLPNGAVWAWQAKYLFEFDASAAGQVTSSVRRVLENEPTLKRYFVAMPFDMPAGDTADRTSAHTRWAEKVVEWEALGRAKGLEVEFVFVGAHALLTALTQPDNAGRARYWFGADVLTAEWQGRRLEETVAKAGRRYTPRLHVDVDTVQAVHAVGRVDAYAERWRHVLAHLREARQWGWRAPGDMAEVFAEVLPRCATALDEVDSALERMIAAVCSTADLPPVDTDIEAAVQALRRVDDALHEHALTKDRYFVGDAASLYSQVQRASSALWRGVELARAAGTRAARDRVLLLTGRAGVGKTHLLCDVATHRILDGQPTILLLGQDFDGRSLLDQIGERTQLGGSPEDVLAVLNAAAEAAGCMGLVMIDAVNESEQPERWRDDSRALIAAAARYPHVAVVLSCRTEFVDAVIGDLPVPRVEHLGFAEATDVAVGRFTQEFGLEPPTFPVLNPEFGNPLFLKLTCEALATLGATRFPFGSAGLTTICDAFLEAVNRRLAEPTRCDYDEPTDPVRRVVKEIALISSGAFARDDVRRITDQALPDRSWSRSLMRGLLTEGVPTELSDGRLAFGYQRLGDVTRATAIAEGSLDQVRDWLGALGDDYWRERGVLDALAAIVPERHNVELASLAMDDEGKVRRDFIDGFLESLLLRSPESISPRAVEIVEGLLDRRYRTDEIWDRLARIACVPGHPLNAQWLHERLAGREVADRDRSWSAWLVGALDVDEGSPVGRLIEWAWPPDLENRSAVPDDVGELATLLLGWLLATSDRRVRDRATKAIVSVGERAPVGFATALARFRGTNDPYVIERLAAAACGVALRTDDADATHRIADAALELVADGWPTHLLTRDFVRRITGVARARGWEGDEHLPPYGADWPVLTRSIEEIEALAGPPAFSYGSVWHSLSGGDFGRYVLEPALRDVVSEDPMALEHLAERAVFDRVLDLGWTPEHFAEIDRRRRGGRDGPVERVGKKYQWIGFYETLGRIADHHLIKESWNEEERPYAFAEQLVWRDIDPTVLVRKPVRSTMAPSWFSPAVGQFPRDMVDEYPSDMNGVPDPMDLIAVSDQEGEPWLVLVSTPNWDQPLPPEVEALRRPRLAMWMNLSAYLVPIGAATALSKWAKGKDWSERRMPESPEAHNVLLGAHPDDPKWSAADGSEDPWDDVAARPRPAELLACAAWYGGTGTSRDVSAENETAGYVPTRRLVELLGLSRGVDFMWRDPAGIGVRDPSVVLGGPSALVMRRDLLSRLADAGLTLFWTVLIGNELHRGDYGIPGDEYRWVSASASYAVNGDRVGMLAARALRCRPGPRTERRLRWTPRTTEA